MPNFPQSDEVRYTFYPPNSVHMCVFGGEEDNTIRPTELPRWIIEEWKQEGLMNPPDLSSHEEKDAA